MSRVQLALNVSDLSRAIEFYRKLFGAEPAKQRPGYANFSIADPPLKLVLIEHPATPADATTATLNHLGIEVDTSGEVIRATERLSHQGLATAVEMDTTCCFAKQDKVWVNDPDGAPWEVYTVLDDAPIGDDASSEACCCTAMVGPQKAAGSGRARSGASA